MKVQLITTLCAVGCVLVVPLASTQVAYTWVDKNGVIHFSDTPNQDAKTIDLPDMEAAAPAPEVESTEPPIPQANVEEPEEAPATQNEKPLPLQLAIQSPKHDETIRSNLGLISVELELNRKLGIGEQLQLILDGNPYGAPQSNATWQLKNIDRGTHTLSIHAKRSGKLIASSSPITVHLHRTSIKPSVNGAN